MGHLFARKATAAPSTEGRGRMAPSMSARTHQLVHDVLHSPGQPLDAATRAYMEPRFGHDFSKVRVHAEAPGSEGLATGLSKSSSEDEADKVAGNVARAAAAPRENDSRYDFSRVRIHSGARAAESAQAIGARAYTVGSNVVFGAGRYQPAISAGRRLLAHELTHVVQQEQSGIESVQRFEAEDAAQEMVGKTFNLNEAVTASGQKLAKGTSVTIAAWLNDKTTVTATVSLAGKKSVSVTLEKSLLVPASDAKSGLIRYHAGVAGIEKKYAELEKGISDQEKVVSDWKVLEKKYTTPDGHAEWQRQLGVKEDALNDLKYRLSGGGYTAATLPERLKITVGGKKTPISPQSKLLNRALIEETMFNSFDASVLKWVTHYNNSIGAPKKWLPLDANLVKSMLYQESHFGTHGKFLMPPPYAKRAEMTRFNIGQAIDSSGPQQIMMIKEISPAIATKHKIDDVTKDMHAAQTRRRELVAKGSGISLAEKAELRTIDSRTDDGRFWNEFFRTDPRWQLAVEEFFAQTATARNLDYDYWIGTSVRWLFEKRAGEKDWANAIRAYNGSGPDAQAYKKDVIGRRDAAKTATAAKKDFEPTQHY